MKAILVVAGAVFVAMALLPDHTHCTFKERWEPLEHSEVLLPYNRSEAACSWLQRCIAT